jgi:CHASE3 domain sensor protein
MIGGALRKRTTQLAFGFAIAVLLVVGSLAYRSVAASNESNTWAQHTQEVLENLEGIRSAMGTIVESVRGFVLTGDDIYLQSYHTEISNLAKRETSVRTLTVDNAEQQRSFSILEGLGAERIRRSEMLISLRREKGLARRAGVLFQPACASATVLGFA